MDTIRFSFDDQRFQSKPSGDEIRRISNSIAWSRKELTSKEFKQAILHIGNEGCTFSPATFKNGRRNKDNFEQQQLIALDFDNKDENGKISFDVIRKRADDLGLPIIFAYDTLSSREHDKFRVVFLNDAPINDIRVAAAVQLAMGGMFPEADSSCFRDVSKLYFGGKGLIHYDEKLPKTNIEEIFKSYTHYMKKKYGKNHYKEHLVRFSNNTGIALNENKLLDIKITDYPPEPDNPTEEAGANQNNKNGKNSPRAIIYNQIANGEFLPKYYIINFECTENSSVKTPERKPKNHKEYRSGVLQDMNKCRLFYDFSVGSRKLTHDELFGIATNLIQVETGIKYFVKKISEYPELYPDDVKNEKWKTDISYMSDYYPESCDKYCPYKEECTHCKNILSTIHAKRGNMEKIVGYCEEFYSTEEMQEDVYQAIDKAFHASGKKFYIIKAQTGAGKSHSYIKLMQEYPNKRFIIAVPTNLLKKEIFKKAKKLSIEVMKTPSLEEIKADMPSATWKHIQRMYKRGQHYSVHPYIQKELKKKDIPCLRKYMEKRETLKTWDGCVITTHRYLLNMDEERLDEFDSIIIDEDILFKSIIPNQGEISVPDLKRLEKETSDLRLSEKIKKLLKASKVKSCMKVEGFEWDNKGRAEKSMLFDIPSFCRAKRFYLRQCENEENLGEEKLAFLKPVDFPGEKYIMVSATADEEICGWYFGEDNIEFYECKKAKYMGELKQYCEKSMSRACLNNNKGMVEKLMNRFGMNEDKTITFMKEGIGSLHFGNTEGSNMLEGKDILVVGTPYHAEFLYKLAAISMGIEFDEEEKMMLQIIDHNGYRFRFTTFRNEGLRKIHLWMIESELEQAVGRARLLRNACTVHLFSNFPLHQAKMIRDFDFERD